ncbi:hypothetical protein Tco_1381196 [Tanacetum coccineum]
MDNPNITMEEYIRLQEEKALSRGETFNWQTATYGKMEYCEDEDDCFTNFESEFPAIVLDNTITPREALSWEPTVSPLNDNEIDFRISFDESDDEDYTVIYDENSFSYKIIFVNNLKTDSENDNDKVNMPSFSSPEPKVSYSNDLDFFKDFENEFPAIVNNDALTTYQESNDDDCDKSNLINHHDTSPFLDPYQAAKNDMKCNDNNSGTENFIQNDAPHSGNNNQGNEGICRVDKFEVIKYSIGDNEEFMGIRTLERDSWDQTVNGVSSIYLDIFRKKDEG